VSVSVRKACGRLKYSSESLSRDVGLGSRQFLRMASGGSLAGSRFEVIGGLSGTETWVPLCRSVIDIGLGAISC